MSPRWMVWTPSTSTTNDDLLAGLGAAGVVAIGPDAGDQDLLDLVLARARRGRTRRPGWTAGASARRATCLPLARGSGRSSGWLKVTMSPVIPRPVGPTTDWNGSLTTTASLPRNRTHVRPYQVSSIAPDSDTAACTARIRRGAPARQGVAGLFLELAWGVLAAVAFAGLAVGHPGLPARVGLARRPTARRPTAACRRRGAPCRRRSRRRARSHRHACFPRSRPTCRRRR